MDRVIKVLISKKVVSEAYFFEYLFLKRKIDIGTKKLILRKHKNYKKIKKPFVLKSRNYSISKSFAVI